MGYLVTAQTLRADNRIFAGTGGVSRNNGAQGFQPGFYDTESGQVAISCFADGRPAPIHVLEGVPADWVMARNSGGGILSVKTSVVSGFIRAGRFYSRAEAAAQLVRIGQGH